MKQIQWISIWQKHLEICLLCDTRVHDKDNIITHFLGRGSHPIFFGETPPLNRLFHLLFERQFQCMRKKRRGIWCTYSPEKDVRDHFNNIDWWVSRCHIPERTCAELVTRIGPTAEHGTYYVPRSHSMLLQHVFAPARAVSGVPGWLS